MNLSSMDSLKRVQSLVLCVYISGDEVLPFSSNLHSDQGKLGSGQSRACWVVPGSFWPQLQRLPYL